MLAVFAIGGCDDSGSQRSAVLEYDSAGVAVLQSSPPYVTWSLDPDPVVRIGVVDGDPEYQLSEVVYAARLRDGRMVVVDGGSSEVRWYLPDGSFSSRVGGWGEGPAEFRRVVGATLTAHDTLVLYDSRNRRLTWWGPGGSLAQTRRVELGSSLSTSLFPLDSGRLLIAEERPTRNFGAAEFNYARDSILVMVTSSAEAAVDTVMRLPGREAATWADHADGGIIATRQFDVPLGQRTLVGGMSNRIVVVASGQHELAFFNRRGQLVRLARRADIDRPTVPASLRREFVESEVERAEMWGGPSGIVRAAAEARIELLPKGRRLPAFDRVLVDAIENRIWTRDFLPKWRSEGARGWTVHDSAGRVLGRVTIPAGIDVMHVASSYLVGVERDAMDVEYVAVYVLN